MEIEKIDRNDLGAGKNKLLENKDFSDSWLCDVNGKGVSYENCTFSASIIERGYFHHSRFKKCKFIGTRFKECNFRQATFEQCIFDYAEFDRCVIPVPQILANLPSHPNVRWEVLHNLRANTRAIGDTRYDSAIVRKEIDTEVEHWRQVRRCSSGYYEKYNNPKDKIEAWYHSSRLFIEGYLWGYGESLTRLCIATISGLLLLSFFHTINANEVGSQTLSVLSTRFVSSIFFVFKLFIDLPSVDPNAVAASPFISTFVVLIRYITIGLAIPVLYKQIAKR